MQTVSKRQLNFLGHVMRNNGLKKAGITGQIAGEIERGDKKGKIFRVWIRSGRRISLY